MHSLSPLNAAQTVLKGLRVAVEKGAVSKGPVRSCQPRRPLFGEELPATSGMVRREAATTLGKFGEELPATSSMVHRERGLDGTLAGW